MARRLLQLLVFSVVTVWTPSVAFPEDNATKDPQPPPKEVQPLTAGNPAPFSGILMTYHRAARLGVKADQCDAKVMLAKDEQTELADIKLGYCRGARENDREACRLKLKVLENEVAKVEPQWWEHPALWFTVGVVTAVGVIFGAAGWVGAFWEGTICCLSVRVKLVGTG